jgi:hypothetical protein
VVSELKEFKRKDSDNKTKDPNVWYMIKFVVLIWDNFFRSWKFKQ